MEDCQNAFDEIKEKMVTTPILVLLDWSKEFHVHVDTSSIMLRMVLEKPREGDIHHPIVSASCKLSKVEKNYTTTEREGLALVYALQNFRNYLLGSHFKLFTGHLALCYLVNKPVLRGRIC